MKKSIVAVLILLGGGLWPLACGKNLNPTATTGSTVTATPTATTVPIITTYAGNGTAGYSGDNGAATSAELNGPRAVAMDPSGNLYISEQARIREVLLNGLILTVAGDGTDGYSGDNGTLTSAELSGAQGIALDSSGNLYFSDYLYNRIRKVSTGGIITTVAGDGTGAYSGDGGIATSAEINSPAGVAVDSSGNLYISDQSNNRIREVLVNGLILTVAGDGTGGYSGDGGIATSAEIYNPIGIALDSSGNLYVADSNNSRIRKVSVGGTITTVAGDGTGGYSGDGGAATSAELDLPQGIAVDSLGNIYISDQANNRIRKVSTSGIISTVAGNGTNGYLGDGGVATSAEFNSPYGIAVDSSGDLYIADNANYRIRKVN